MGCIVAILNLDGAPVDEAVLRTLLDVPPYGGHAGAAVGALVGSCVQTHGSVGFGFVPLRANSDAAGRDQPGRLGDGLWGVLDGRLDDRSSLVRRLQRDADRDLATASDVQLLLHAYAYWGEDCVDHLLGDFAFCLWDGLRHRLVCGRDHFGVKPLYYACDGRTLVVGNVLRSLRRHRAVSGRLRDEAVADLLLFEYPQDASATLFADISRVPSAHRLTCVADGGAPRVTRYWALDVRPELRYPHPREYVEHFEQELSVAVRDRVRDAPVGVLMTGGLDSSSVAAMAVDALGRGRASREVRAYTAVYDRVMPDDERHYSTIAASGLGIPITHLAVDDYEFFERWDGDALPPEPTAEPLSAIMTDLLGLAAVHAPVVLTGEGGDPMLLPSSLVDQVGHVPIVRIIGGVWSCGRFRTRPPLGVRSAVKKWWRPDTAAPPGWLTDGLLRRVDVRARWERYREPLPPPGVVRADAVAGLLTEWWPLTFEAQDPGTTQRLVEVRNPYFDVRLASFALRLPSFPWCVHKTILRSAMKGRLPEVIRQRPKTPLAGDPVSVRRPWTMHDVMVAFDRAPGIDEFVDRRRFEKAVRPERLLRDEEVGTVGAISLATWLRYADGHTRP